MAKKINKRKNPKNNRSGGIQIHPPPSPIKHIDQRAARAPGPVFFKPTRLALVHPEFLLSLVNNQKRGMREQRGQNDGHNNIRPQKILFIV
ncbi:MAG: hypothetical protein IID52_07010 [Proteobacteria bacterium]|nr:hypothetical protein [Pseudomonadota bacterium]